MCHEQGFLIKLIKIEKDYTNISRALTSIRRNMSERSLDFRRTQKERRAYKQQETLNLSVLIIWFEHYKVL